MSRLVLASGIAIGRLSWSFLALERLEDLGGGASGEAMKQDGGIAKPDAQAWGAVIMGGAAAFAARPAPDTAELLDDGLGADLSVERETCHRDRPVGLVNFGHRCLGKT